MIKYIKGDLFDYIKDKKNILIPHCVNNEGKWGRGFVVNLSKHFPKAEEKYREWYKTKEGFPWGNNLGKCQIVEVADNIYVANMVGQNGVGRNKGRPPIRYSAILLAMLQVKQWMNVKCKEEIWTIHTVQFGAGLAGGDWNLIEKLIEEIWVNFDVTVYNNLYNGHIVGVK